MKDLTTFGTSEHPLRCSSLSNLVKCPFRGVVMFLDLDADTSGPAAQTGSMLHHGIATWHKTGQDFAVAHAAMVKSLAEFPEANIDECNEMFIGYVADPRNKAANIVAVEQSMRFAIPCSPNDPTQKEIVIQGTLDQIRNDRGMYRVYDVKSSKRDGYDLMCDHTLQIAAYCLGAALQHKRRVEPGALILTRQYNKRVKRGESRDLSPLGAYVEFPWGYNDITAILKSVQNVVAHIRGGSYWVAPGDYCRYCPAAGPDNCIPQLQSLTIKG